MSIPSSTIIEPESSRILVVDDDASIRELLRIQLTKAGYDVVLAVDGEEGLLRAKETEPDIILLDVLMPRLDGYETSIRLKGDDATSSIPILMVSALGAPTDRVRALDIGIDDFISKPFDRVEMLARVRSLLRVKRLHRSLSENNEELHKAYQIARDAEARYHSMVNDALDAVFVVHGETGRIIECNPAAVSLTGLDEATLCHYSIGDLMDTVVDDTQEATSAKDLCERHIQDANGSKIPVAVRRSRVQSLRGDLDQYTVRDLTLQRSVQDEKLNTERMNAILQTALAINDEVNNPLSVILGNAEFIHKGLRGVDSKIFTRLNNIIEAVHRIHNVLGRLTQIVRPATREYLPGTEMLDLDKSLPDAVKGE